MNFREKLKHLLVATHFSNKHVAKAIGRPESTVSNWLSEESNRKPTTEQFLIMARLFKVTMESLTDPEMDLVPSEMPLDEFNVLETYRYERDHNGIDWKRACSQIKVQKPGIEQRP